MPNAFPILRTPRLTLRQVVLADAPALFSIHSDAEWMRWYGVDPVSSMGEAEHLADLFSSWFAAGTGYRWALERREDRQLIGTCGLFRWNKSWRNCVIGYEIGRAQKRQGYMLEAITAILDYGFDVMSLHRVQAETHPDNLASISLASRLGFRFEGVHREQAFWGGRFHDLNCYSLLERDWRRLRQDA
ncbi:GNAT family N-acetyltransferase [Noviherbaspirillum denitrificans]|uniref:GNAT family acetyltransferase n=1 Tax=Noviherbaspirillum denitrificans TaxID=1968433 RepID=A0A254TR44_9BURK|nr:GNAT family protein [Noviherbaspirillum denitrificans]OWW22208.1 GNAT family acetyltransferase [Noviherbaspirillum denitrificans]